MAALTCNRIGYPGPTIPSPLRRSHRERQTTGSPPMRLWGRRRRAARSSADNAREMSRAARAVESCLVLRHQLLVPVWVHAGDPAGQVVRESAVPATQRRDDDKIALHPGSRPATRRCSVSHGRAGTAAPVHRHV